MEKTHDYWSDVASLADDIHDDFARFNTNKKEILQDFILQMAIDPTTKNIYAHEPAMILDALYFIAMRCQELQLDSDTY